MPQNRAHEVSAEEEPYSICKMENYLCQLGDSSGKRECMLENAHAVCAYTHTNT